MKFPFDPYLVVTATWHRSWGGQPGFEFKNNGKFHTMPWCIFVYVNDEARGFFTKKIELDNEDIDRFHFQQCTNCAKYNGLTALEAQRVNTMYRSEKISLAKAIKIVIATRTGSEDPT